MRRSLRVIVDRVPFHITGGRGADLAAVIADRDKASLPGPSDDCRYCMPELLCC